ncbi:MAG: Na/Pi cotransporter family protein [Planctomycetes bacterium]|nr:Na/Pi cotransporter family protein [Planctomycetota bacterium]MCB9935541.1 Na/Pi cotransporter family protein [Planctomycetota bacterium]
MFTVFTSVLGGVGLFLLGMILMTDGLKALAGDALRSILSKYTTNRWSAVGAGAGLTAIVQSSSATTVATIGFVSAGLLPFSNAVGVIIGANLGTTSTGWLVSLLGLKLNVGQLLLPVIGFGAFAKLVTRGRLAQIGQTLAGFGVIFVGIDVLQAGMKELATQFDPSTWPEATLGGRALLVLIGVAMTVVMQSSSAAVATTLAALSGGTIDVQQAAALVVGQNIGTTITAGIASIGGSVSAKRTALAHIIFNLVTAAVAFVILPWFTHGIEEFAEDGLGGDHALTIAAFHTAFNLLGAAIFLPVLPQYSRFIERRIKLKGPRLTQHLDTSLLSVPAVAVEAARNVLKEIAATMFDDLRRMLEGERKMAAGGSLEQIGEALAETRRFLQRIPPPETTGFEFHRQLSTVHALDHLERLVEDMHEPESLTSVRRNDSLRKVGEDMGEILALLAKQLRDPDVEPEAQVAEAFSHKLAEDRRTARPAILEATAARRIDAEQALKELAAQRWLDRLAYHIWRSAHHLREMTRKEAKAAPPTSADAGMPTRILKREDVETPGANPPPPSN